MRCALVKRSCCVAPVRAVASVPWLGKAQISCNPAAPAIRAHNDPPTQLAAVFQLQQAPCSKEWHLRR